MLSVKECGKQRGYSDYLIGSSYQLLWLQEHWLWELHLTKTSQAFSADNEALMSVAFEVSNWFKTVVKRVLSN